MPVLQCLKVFVLIITTVLVACGSDSSDQSQGGDDNTAVTQQGLLDVEWTLETVRGNDGEYRPLPLDSTWSLTFDANGSVAGGALCNQGSGSWQAGDSTLSIVEWLEEETFCESSVRIPTVTQAIVDRLFQGEIVISRIETGRLFMDTGDGAQLVLSGRPISEGEQAVAVETLIRTEGGTRASNGDPVFGDLSTPYVVYRDTESLEADYALLPEDFFPWPALPSIDFTSNLVIGVYLPLDANISSDVFVRGARLTSNGLEIEVARFGPNVPDEAPSISCTVATALSAPWTLVRIGSIVEPINIFEMARPICSGIPIGDDL